MQHDSPRAQIHATPRPIVPAATAGASDALAIETRSLTRTFKGGVEAVRGVDLRVAEGEVFGFLGPNGAGVDVVADPAQVRRQIGVALQEIGLDPVQSGRELLELQCGLYGIRGGRAKARTVELLELVGLSDAADRRTKTYSGGMKRRLDLASALVHSPAVLFLDEPTTGLDPSSRRTIWEEVRRINDAGTTVFLTTQYLEEADQLCDRLAIIDNGAIVAEGTPGELKAKMGHDVVTLALGDAEAAAIEAAVRPLAGLERVAAGPDAVALYVEDGAGSITEIVRLLEGARIRVGAITVSRPSLDDVFLQATGRRLEGAEKKESR